MTWLVEMSDEKTDKLNWGVVVDTGIYAIIRHPMYLSFILLILALIFICQH